MKVLHQFSAFFDWGKLGKKAIMITQTVVDDLSGSTYISSVVVEKGIIYLRMVAEANSVFNS